MTDCFMAPACDVDLVFRTKADRKVSFTVPTGVALCEECSKSARVDTFLDDELWKTIVSAFKKLNRVYPDRNLTTLGLRPIPRVLLP